MTMRKRPALPVDRRRPAADRRTAPLGQGHRADLPAAAQDASIPDIVDYDLPEAGVLPQLRDRLDRQALPEARAEGDERDLGRAPDVADQADRGRRRRLRRARLRTRSPGGRFGNVDYARDLLLTEGPVDHLDHASYQQFWGGKAGIDATRKLPDRGLHRDGGWPEMVDVRPGDRRRWSTGAGRSTGCERDRRRAAARDRPGRVKAFLRLVMIEHSVFALPFAYLAALTAMSGATGSVHWGDAAADHGRDGRRAHLRDGRQPDHRPARSTRRNPRTAKRELVTGAVSRAHRLDRRGGRAGGLPGRRRRCSTRSAWRSRRSPWCRWSSTRTASGSPTSRTPSSALAQAIGPVGAWLAVTGRWSLGPAGGARRSRSASGSAAST